MLKSFIIREVKIKTTVRCSLPPMRMALDIFPQDMKVIPMLLFHCSIFHNRQEMETTQVCVEWIDKEIAHLYNKTLAFKKEILPFAKTWMNMRDHAN
jgi:hypothetical protein